MYTLFFGFKEKPFQLVPNPAFLYLSRGHEEAMAHLEYAIANGDGFVAITGEVGTGKTTLCRAFLDRLDPTTEAAYIFNPRLDATQLLKAVNDEFGLEAGSNSNKELIDILNRFLIARKREGKSALLLIDEAQNLSPEVLEQLRLLSNLETATEKLLQIILVGQPELDELLASHQLRQLAQRITLRCRLIPMTRSETGDYIRHRLRLVSQGSGPVFTTAAIRAVHRHSRGIPRLINIICDRALLAAFTLERYKITATLVRQAARELDKADLGNRLPHAVAIRLLVPTVLGAFLILLLYPSIFHHRDIPSERPITEEETADSIAPSVAEQPVSMAVEVEKPVEISSAAPVDPPTADDPAAISSPLKSRPMEPGALASRLYGMNSRTSRQTAILQILHLWGIDAEASIAPGALPDDPTFFRLAAGRYGMEIYRSKGDLESLFNLDLPAILLLRPPGDPEPRYLALCSREENGLLLLNKDGPFLVPDETLDSFWQGEAYIPWKDFRILQGTIPMKTSDDAILALKLLLEDLGFGDLSEGPVYDTATRQAILAIQERNGIATDGVVGPATKIVLYNEDRQAGVPHLSESANQGCRVLERGGLE